jgi:hypothetical protein
MERGYQIIEPTELNQLVRSPIHHELAVAIMYWLIPKVLSKIGGERENVELEVIRVSYQGTYPALGVHYKHRDHLDLGPLIESTVDALLHERPISELVDAIAASDVSWRDVTETLMASPQ